MAESNTSPLITSVSGIRGIVGHSITDEVAAAAGAALGDWIKESTGEESPNVCVGRDSRPSGEQLIQAAMHGLCGVGCSVTDLGIVATPTVAVMVEKLQAAGGLVITASHNPGEWNGIKFLTSDGCAPDANDANEIISRCQQGSYFKHSKLNVTTDRTGNESHIAKVLNTVDLDLIRSGKFAVVLDSVNGAGGPAGIALLEEFGCRVIHLNSEPTGVFAHPPEPLKQNLTELADRTNEEQAACGFAQDPDADRLAIIDETGRYIGEEYTLVLAAKRVLDLNGSGTIVTNLSTSRMIDDLVAKYANTKVIRTAVGEANVVAAMKYSNGLVGGEGNGGVILPTVCLVRDSLSAMALTLSLMAAEKTTLSEIVESLPRYVMMKEKFGLQKVGGREAMNRVLDRVTNQFAHEKTNLSDGVRIDFADGWVHLRPSNTEPIIRLIAEAESNTRAKELIQQIAHISGLQ